MRIEIKTVSLTGEPTEAIISHGGRQVDGKMQDEEVIVWNIALFDKTSLPEINIFEEINAFWARLPLQKQDEIFVIYKQIREVFDTVFDMPQLNSMLNTQIAQLYTYHDLASIQHWVTFYSNLRAPENILETFSDILDSTKTRERTYLKDDYMGLVILSISLRIMIPIWGEYIHRTRKETGTALKEYFALRLLNTTTIMHSEPMERLRAYVVHSIPADKSKATAIFSGISTEEYPYWILGLVVIRRLTVGPLSGRDPNTNLVTFIHKYIRQKAQGQEQVFIGMVKDKVSESQGTDGENNLSRLEGYKIKQRTPDGEIVVLAFYMENPEAVAQQVCPDLPPELLHQSLLSVQQLMNENIHDPQITLIQWVLRKAIGPQGIMHLNKPTVLKAMAVTQAVLWYRGFEELAAMVSAIAIPNEDSVQLDSFEARHRISKDQLEVLDRLYPFARRAGGKQKLGKRSNPAVEAIESVANSFSENPWRLTIPNEWLPKVQLAGTNKGNRRFAVRQNVKIRLADLVIAIQSRTL